MMDNVGMGEVIVVLSFVDFYLILSFCLYF